MRIRTDYDPGPSSEWSADAAATPNTAAAPARTSKHDGKPARKRGRSRKRAYRARSQNFGAYYWMRNGVAQLCWTDPLTGQRHQESTGVRSAAVAEACVLAKAAWLREQVDAAALRHAAGRPKPAPPYEIERAVHAYYDRLAAAPNRAASTLRNAERGLNRFLEFCARHRASTVDDLTADLLDAYYAELTREPGRRGARVAISTVNQWVKPIGAALRLAYDDGRAPLLTRSFLRRRLPLVPVAGETNRHLWELDHARALERSQLKAMLRRLLDSARYRGAAIDVMTSLLYGLRRIELTRARVANISDNGLLLEVANTKGARSRHVPSYGFTILGQRLLDVLREGHTRSEWLSEAAYGTLGTVYKRLGIRGHDLRATCATYQLSLDVSGKHRCARLGFSARVEDDSYLRILAEQPLRAVTLEEAMGLEAEFAEVIEIAHKRMLLPRTRRRKNPAPKVKGLMKFRKSLETPE